MSKHGIDKHVGLIFLSRSGIRLFGLCCRLLGVAQLILLLLVGDKRLFRFRMFRIVTLEVVTNLHSFSSCQHSWTVKSKLNLLHLLKVKFDGFPNGVSVLIHVLYYLSNKYRIVQTNYQQCSLSAQTLTHTLVLALFFHFTIL